MKGENILILNEDTMAEAVQLWVNSILVLKTVKVTGVSGMKDGQFEVALTGK